MDPQALLGSINSDETVLSLRGMYVIEGVNDATDDLATFTAARDALVLAGGGTIYFRGTLDLSTCGIFIVGSSTIPLSLVGLDPTANIHLGNGNNNYLVWGHNDSCFPASSGDDGTVTTVPTFGAIDQYKWRQFTAEGGHTLAVGDWIYVWSENSDDYLDGSEADLTYGHHSPGEVVRIKAVSGNTITIDGYVQDFMTTLKYYKRDMAIGPFYVGDFSISFTNPHNSSQSLKATSCVDGQFYNIHYQYPSGNGLHLYGCANMTISDPIMDGTTEAQHAQAGWAAIRITACNGVLIDHPVTKNYRTHFRSGVELSQSTTTGIGVSRGVVARNWIIEQLCEYSGTDDAVNVGEAFYGLVMENCHVHLVNGGLDEIGAFTSSSRSTDFMNCQVEGSIVSCRGFTVRGTNTHVSSCIINRADQGVVCSDNGRGATIDNNILKRCRNGVAMYAPSGDISSNVMIEGVNMEDGGRAFSPIAIFPGASGQKIVHNYIEKSTEFVDSDQGESPAIWYSGAVSLTGVVSVCTSNSFYGWGDPNLLESPIFDEFAFSIGPPDELQDDSEFLAAFGAKNFFA